MSENSRSETRAVETTAAEIADREEVLAMLGETMQYVRDRIDASDPETLEEERLCIQWVRALGYLAGQVRMLKSDADLDEMEDELELLERARKLQEGR